MLAGSAPFYNAKASYPCSGGPKSRPMVLILPSYILQWPCMSLSDCLGSSTIRILQGRVLIKGEENVDLFMNITWILSLQRNDYILL